MKIVSLTAENIKKLKAVEIVPSGDIVTIAGRNAQGKTSVLDSIWWALQGTKNIQAQPIRNGETKARIRLDMGEIVVERRFTPNGSTLIVENAEGARFNSPQKMLDELLGALSFDPLAFASMDPRKQYDELRRVANIDVDIDALDGLNKRDFERRTDINRDAKVKRSAAAAMPVPATVLDHDVDEAAILDQITNAAEKNALIEKRRAGRKTAQETANSKKTDAGMYRDKAARLRQEAAECDAQASKFLDEAAELEKAIDEAAPLPELADVAQLRIELERAQAINKERQQLARRQSVEAEAAALEAQSQELTDAIDARKQAKTEAIARAAMPVDQLGFGDGVVLYKDVPFEQASSAEQLRVSLAIAMAANPKVRVIRIQDGSLLDEDSLAHIEAAAGEKGYQVWIEKVDSSGTVGIVIEDGAVVAIDGERVAVAA